MPTPFPFELIHSDTTCLIVNKPAGMLSVPGRGDLAQGSLIQRVQEHFPEAQIVHRLDMATSGLLLLARGPQWQRVYSKLFAERCIDKDYVAIVSGLVPSDHGEINLPLIADWPNRPKQMVDHQHGKPSLTRYEVLMRDPVAQTTRMRLMPVTGRSHQLRVHLLSLGHPIVGDALYAPINSPITTPRLMLHAQQLSLIHPESLQRICWYNEAPF